MTLKKRAQRDTGVILATVIIGIKIIFNNYGSLFINSGIVYASEIFYSDNEFGDEDVESDCVKEETILAIAKILDVKIDDIIDVVALKKGMTNRSFLFSYNGERYIARIPGEGTEQLVDRAQEAEVYRAINGKNICDDIIYINPQSGYKITKFLNNSRVCNPNDLNDVQKCMKHLRDFHNLNLKVNHEFDIFEKIDFYESLWNGKSSEYKDYLETKKKVFSLKKYIDAHIDRKALTHIDAVPDNFLFVKDKLGQEEIRLIDWEYAGMQDPHVDISMFCIYSMYKRPQIDELINMYFVEGCSDEIRTKIYCYISACGLLWSNWCEYKKSLGIDFGEYSIYQYCYAKDYYNLVQEKIM